MNDHTRDWGVASLFLSGIAALSVLPALLLMRVLVESGFNGLNLAAAFSGYAAAAAMGLVSITSVFFGVRELAAARRLARPPAIGMAGTLLGALDVLAWSGTSIAWHDAVTKLLL